MAQPDTMLRNGVFGIPELTVIAVHLAGLKTDSLPRNALLLITLHGELLQKFNDLVQLFFQVIQLSFGRRQLFFRLMLGVRRSVNRHFVCGGHLNTLVVEH